MRRYFSLLLALVLLLPGCGGAQPPEDTSGGQSSEILGQNAEITGQDAETIARVMLAYLDENEDLSALTWYVEPSDVEGYIQDFYKLEDIPPLDGAIARVEGARAFELAVLQVDEGDVEAVTAALREYLTDRRGAFTGYLPDQAELIDNALILDKGGWVALAVCQTPENAQFAFESCFGEGANAQGRPHILGPDPEDLRPDGRIVYTDPEIDDMTLFDNSAILAAWKSGDDSGLSRQDKEVLAAARAVFDQCVTPDMSDYDKETNLYLWLVTHAEYDQSHYEKQGAPRTSYEPYGPLVRGKGVCLGFATAFQLLMDMADVECITVVGAAFYSRENHAWNMVRLNGQWYCVDPTWDLDGSGRDFQGFQEIGLDQFFTYFNVTSDYMALTDHQWDYDAVPEAAAEDGGRP